MEVSCEYCRSGVSKATGYVTDYVQEAKAVLKTITGRRVEEGSLGEDVMYTAGSQGLHPDQIFDTESDALACASSLLADYEKKKQDNPKYKN